MATPTQSLDIPVDPIAFGIEVQALATSIAETPAGEDLSPKQMRTATSIANMFMHGRRDLLAEFTSPSTSSTTDLIGLDVNAKPDYTLTSKQRIEQAAAKKELLPLANDLDHQEQTRQAIGRWIETLPVKGRRTIDADVVLDSMFAYDLDSLAFKETDVNIAAGRLEAADRALIEQRTLEIMLNSPWSAQFTGLAIMSVLKNKPDMGLSKLAIKADQQFKDLMLQRFPGATAKMITEQFDSGWSYIEAFFNDIDSDYELFTVSNRTKGTTYKLIDPNLVTELWSIEHDDSAEPSVESEINSSSKKVNRATSFDGTTLTFADGSSQKVESPVVGLLHNRLKSLEHNKWLSRGEIAQEIANTLGLKKDAVEQELKDFISKLGGDLVKSAYSRKGNRVLIACGKNWPKTKAKSK